VGEDLTEKQKNELLAQFLVDGKQMSDKEQRYVFKMILDAAERSRNEFEGVLLPYPKKVKIFNTIVAYFKDLIAIYGGRIKLNCQDPRERHGYISCQLLKPLHLHGEIMKRFANIMQGADGIEMYPNIDSEFVINIRVRNIWAEPPTEAEMAAKMTMPRNALRRWYEDDSDEKAIASLDTMTDEEVAIAYDQRVKEAEEFLGEEYITERKVKKQQWQREWIYKAYRDFENSLYPNIIDGADFALQKVADEYYINSASRDMTRWSDFSLVHELIWCVVEAFRRDFAGEGHPLNLCDTQRTMSGISTYWEFCYAELDSYDFARFQYVLPLLDALDIEVLHESRIRMSLTIDNIWPTQPHQ
jgi:hypothetical protein